MAKKASKKAQDTFKVRFILHTQVIEHTFFGASVDEVHDSMTSTWKALRDSNHMWKIANITIDPRHLNGIEVSKSSSK